MRIDPLVVALGAALCLIPVLFGLLVSYWPRPSARRDRANRSVTEMVLDRRPGRINYVDEKMLDVALRDEGDLLAADPPHDNCSCSACTFWREWHRTMA